MLNEKAQLPGIIGGVEGIAAEEKRLEVWAVEKANCPMICVPLEIVTLARFVQE